MPPLFSRLLPPSPLHIFRYTCNGAATFSDGSIERHSTCENINGVMEWSDIGDECRTGKIGMTLARATASQRVPLRARRDLIDHLFIDIKQLAN